MTTGVPALDFLLWLLGFLGCGGIIGTIISHAVTRKMDEDKKERADLENARRQEMVSQHEMQTATGHLARATACAHLAAVGQNKDVSTAIEYYDEARAKEEALLRQRAAERLHGGLAS